MPILSGLIEISVYSCGELRKAVSERKIDMKKLVIILTIAFMLFATQEQRSEQSSTAPEGTPPNVAMEQAEKVPETNTEQREKITEAPRAPISTESKAATKQYPAGQETPLKECTDEPKVAEPEESVECVDKGDQTLAECTRQQ